MMEGIAAQEGVLWRVDGSQGEGGGQILRTALALSAICGHPVQISRIRAGRQKPGLLAQHLTAVAALAEICGARLEGAALGSQELTFGPGPVRAGEYAFDVGTAGSTALVLQAILLPLALAPEPSLITLTGGTHVPWSPPADYVQAVLLPGLLRMGVAARLDVCGWGFYPRGGGQLVAQVEGGTSLRPMAAIRREGTLTLRGVSAVANLPRRIAERQRDRAVARLEAAGYHAVIDLVGGRAPGPGSFLMLLAETGGLSAGFSALGARGKPAEQVADEAVDEFLEFARADVGCDRHLADQLVLPMALASGTSRLTTSRVTSHLLTTLRLIQDLLGCPAQMGGEEGTPGTVTLEGGGLGGERQEPKAERRKERAASREPRSESRGEPVVRKARASDVPAVQRLVAHFAVRGDLLPRTLNELYQHLRDFFVCELGGEVVGIVALSVYWEDLAEVRSLAVKEEAGGRGLGAALVRACLGEAARLGVRRVFALTYRPGFFEKLGFRVIDKRELPQKIWKDCVKCAKFACCDEVALICDTAGEAR